MAKPTKHKIQAGTTDKVTPTGAPRKAVKKIQMDTDVDATDETLDEAEASKDAGAKGTSGRKAGVRKVDVKKSGKPESAHSSKRVTERGTPAASGRYTPPTVKFEEMPSPIWVPILMFTLFILGMLAIFLNYVALLPGATSNWYLLLGLGFILAGIITATQYR